ncbi:MAG: potassium channel family protein [Desulfobaccales bacterium]
MEQQEFWQKIESFLRNYDEVYSQVRWFGNWGGLTRGREGHFVFLRFVFLAGLYVAAFSLPLSVWSKILLTIIAGYLIVDMFMLPTSIALSGIPILPLRALVMVFFIYLSICIAFGLLYITLCRSSFNIDPDLIDLLYFSGTTLSTLGLGDIIPARHTVLARFLVISEVLIGIYFWAVLVGMIISRAIMDVKRETSLPK